MTVSTLRLPGPAIGRIPMTLVAVLVSATTAVAQPSGLDGDISDEIRAFCTNIADDARDQRYLLQKKELEGLQTEIERRIAELEQRKKEYEHWLGLREDFLRKAEGGLVDIYTNMRADAAAEKLEHVNINVAAAIIMQLKPRLASQILNEMDPQTVARLTGIIASAADRNAPGDRS